MCALVRAIARCWQVCIESFGVGLLVGAWPSLRVMLGGAAGGGRMPGRPNLNDPPNSILYDHTKRGLMERYYVTSDEL